MRWPLARGDDDSRRGAHAQLGLCRPGLWLGYVWPGLGACWPRTGHTCPSWVCVGRAWACLGSVLVAPGSRARVAGLV